MAKKKLLNPLEDPPTASSSHEEQMDTSSGDEEDISDPVTIPSVKKSPSDAVAAKKLDFDSDSGSETEAESDSETELASNPRSGTAAKPKNKEAAKQSGKKRPSEGTSTEVNAKRAKKASRDEDNKKPYFQRLWSEEDEITLLQGMIDYNADTGKSPYEDMIGFYELVKESISFDVSKNQFVEKIRALKIKYMGKGKKGVEPSFTKGHDKKCLELAKCIWGSDGMALESAVKSRKSERKKKTKVEEEEDKEVLIHGEDSGENVEEVKEVLILGGDSGLPGARESDWFEKSFLVGSIASFGVDEHYVKQRWSSVPMETKRKFEEKWKLLQANEFEFVLQKTQFLNEVTGVIAEAS